MSAWPTTLVALLVVKAVLAVEPDSVRIGFLPLMNYSSTAAAKSICTEAIQEELVKLPWAVADSADISMALRDNRIRTTVALSIAELTLLRERLGITHVLCGSVQHYVYTKDFAEVAVNLRLIDLTGFTVSWSGSVNKAIENPQSIFDLLKSRNRDRLSSHVAAKLISSLRRTNLSEPMADHQALVVAPLVNETTVPFASEIATAELVTILSRQSIAVVDPGVVLHLMQSQSRSPAPQVNQEILTDLKKQTGANWIVTGEISEFSHEDVAEYQETPHITVHLRLLRSTATSVAAGATSSTADSIHLIPFGADAQRLTVRECTRVLADAFAQLHYSRHEKSQ